MGVSPVISFLLSLHLLPLLLLILSILTAAPGPNSSPVFLHSNSPLSRKPLTNLPSLGLEVCWVGTLSVIFYSYSLFSWTKALVTGAFTCSNDVTKIMFPTLPLRLCFSLLFFLFCMWPNSLLIQLCSLYMAGNMATGSPSPMDNPQTHGIKMRHSLFPYILCMRSLGKKYDWTCLGQDPVRLWRLGWGVMIG